MATASLPCGVVVEEEVTLAVFRGEKANNPTAISPIRQATMVVFNAFSDGSPRSSRGPLPDEDVFLVLMTDTMRDGGGFSTLIFPERITPRGRAPSERRVVD